MIKRFFCISILCSIFMVPALAGAGNDPWRVKLPFKSAVIHYDVKGTEKGAETLYLRDWGNQMVKVTKTAGKIMFISTSTDSQVITTAKEIITIDMKKKQGEKMTNPRVYFLEEYKKLSSKEKATVRKNLKEIGSNLATQMGGSVKVKGAKFMGFDCDVVNAMGFTTYNITGTPVPLKAQGSLMGIKMDTVATKIDRNAPVPDEMFRAPEGVEVVFNKEQDDMNRGIASSIMEKLKDPDAAKKEAKAVEDAKKAMKEDQRRRQEEDANNQENTGEETSDQTEDEGGDKDIGEMMNKGMDALKGIFQ